MLACACKVLQEICSGSGHAGANSARWACAYVGCLLVGQAQQLGEHEGLPSLWSEASQGIGHSHLLSNVIYHLSIYRESGSQRGFATSPAAPRPQFLDARIAGDSEEPRPS
jgi:hypothetical protein